MDCKLPSYSIKGILQAKILEWVAIPFLDLADPGVILQVYGVTEEVDMTQQLNKNKRRIR